jgi:hypothetical protein
MVASFVMLKRGFKSSDPGPDDSRKGTDKPDVVALLKKVKGVTFDIPQMPDQTPLGKFIDGGGAGFVPHWNPGDDDNGKGPGNTPTNNADKGPTAKQLAELANRVNVDARQLQGIAGSMGEVEGLANENAPGVPANKNGGSKGRSGGSGDGSGNGSDNNSGKNKYLGTDLSLGPRPDLVNPPHSKTTGKTGGATSNVLAAGLLEGGSSFSSNGPSGFGSIGGGTGHGAAGVRLR